MVLAFWKGEMDGLDPSDPQYDEYKLNHDQIDFGINESKQRLLYDQGKLSASKMAQFYLNWAKKVPRDGAFWRTLQTRAAQFMQAASARSSSVSAAAAKKAYDDAQAKLARGLAPGAYVKDMLRNVAIVNGLVDARDTKGIANLSDPAMMQDIIDGINEHPENILYIKDGVPISGQNVLDDLNKIDPDFRPRVTAEFAGSKAHNLRKDMITGGGLTTDYIIGALKQSNTVNLSLAEQAAKNDKKADTNKYRKAAGEVSEFARDAQLWGISPSYSMIIEQRDQILSGPGSVTEKAAALDRASKDLMALARTPGLDARTIVTLTREAGANAGEKGAKGSSSFGEDYLGIKTPSGVFDPAAKTGAGSTGSNERIATLWAQFDDETTLLKDDPENYSLTFGKRDPETGEFTLDPDGAEIGVVPNEDIARHAVRASTAVISQVGGQPHLVTVVGREVRTVARNGDGVTIRPGRQAVDADGKPVFDESGDPAMVSVDDFLGWEFQWGSGDKITRAYELPDGTVTSVPPWAMGTREYDNKNGTITVDVSNIVPDDAIAYVPHEVAINGLRRSGIPNVGADFSSLIALSVAVSDNPRALAREIAGSAEIMRTLTEQQAAAAEVEFDETGNIVAGDAAKFERIRNQENRSILTAAGYLPTPVSETYDPTGGRYVQTLADRASAKSAAEGGRPAGMAGPRVLPGGKPPVQIKVPTYRPAGMAGPAVTPGEVVTPTYTPPGSVAGAGPVLSPAYTPPKVYEPAPPTTSSIGGVRGVPIPPVVQPYTLGPLPKRNAPGVS
jgi:hypothetical protein